MLRHCWFGGRKGIQPVKNSVVGCWHGYISEARCRLAYGPADATLLLTASSFNKSRWVLPFWHRLTWLVLEKGPLNGYCCCVISTHSIKLLDGLAKCILPNARLISPIICIRDTARHWYQQHGILPHKVLDTHSWSHVARLRTCNTEINERKGLPPFTDLIVRKLVNSLFGHVARLWDDTLAHQAIQHHTDISLGRLPKIIWKCPLAHPWSQWLYLIHSDTNCAICQRHSGVTNSPIWLCDNDNPTIDYGNWSHVCTGPNCTVT